MLRGVYPERSEGLSMTWLVLGVKLHDLLSMELSFENVDAQV